jgi:hypothetical protein
VRAIVRNTDIGELQDTFLVSAVVMILVIRLQLWLTHYPQLGSGRLHIAHLLWGGLLMLIALGILLSFVGRSLRRPAAVVGGIGFGFFIDELGKFITEDNDYFFKPAAGVIYVVFVVLFIATRAMQTRRGVTPAEYVANAADVLVDAARRPLDERERRLALEWLDRSGRRDPFVEHLRELLQGLECVPTRGPSLPARVAMALRQRYEALAATTPFASLLTVVFLVWALVSLGQVVVLVSDVSQTLAGARTGDLSFVNVATVVSSAVAAVLVLVGVRYLWRGDRIAAYGMFDRAVLVQIFITQVFSFVESQFAAVFGLGLDILLLVTIRFMLHREQDLEAQTKDAAPRGGLREAVPAGA